MLAESAQNPHSLDSLSPYFPSYYLGLITLPLPPREVLYLPNVQNDVCPAIVKAESLDTIECDQGFVLCLEVQKSL